jgi:hypothetical protein
MRWVVGFLVFAACSSSNSDAPSSPPSTTAPDASADATTTPLDSGVTADDGGPKSVDAATEAASADAGNFPARFAAPYVATWHDTNLATLSKDTGNKFWTLAFVIPETGGACTPTWNGYEALNANGYGTYIDSLRAAGGDVIVSFGGADGGELGKACTTVADAQAAYQTVVDAFHLTRIDLDIESGLESDATSIDRRNKALHALQLANPTLKISYTLGVDRTGLPSAQRNLLSNALANGVTVDIVNVMAMDYGPCYTDMGQAAIDAAAATRDQLATLGMKASVGVTPMLGANDVKCEVFSTTDATALVDYAQANSFVRVLAYWKENGDAGDPPFDYPSNQYIDIFKTFH